MSVQLIILAALGVAANGLALYAAPSVLRAYPFVYSAQGSSFVTPTQHQYSSQDQLGQYAYGYAEPLSSKQESRTLDGITRGSYSYRDATGQLQTVDYTADASGFHVAATNLPRAVQPQEFRASTSASASSTGRSTDNVSHRVAAAANVATDTVHVAAAHKSSVASHEEAQLRLAQIGSAQHESNAVESNVRLLELPAAAADTADVAAAKSVHLKQVEVEKLRNEVLGVHSPVLVPRVYSYSVPRYYTGFYY